MEPVRFSVYSDYLCPWCFNAAIRLRRLEVEFTDRVEIEWRSYLLRPRERTRPADLEKFRRYTESWQRPAAETDSGTFRVWEGDAGPPSSSIPAHRVAKAAASLGDEAFRRMQMRLFEAYFSENRDITAEPTQRELWKEADLPTDEFDRTRDETWLHETMREHRDAREYGVTGVPSIQLSGNDAVIVGAHPMELYRRWVNRTLERRAAGETT
jgi:predicted DsbA family dithiol-disulfide isomerase